MSDRVEEERPLQRCINDLISIVALPALWSGREPRQIVANALEAAVGILRLDLAYLCQIDMVDGPPVEMVRSGAGQIHPDRLQDVTHALGREAARSAQASVKVIPNPAGAGEISIATFPLGLHQIGVLIAGSQRADFPTQIESLLLRVMGNQVAIGLQEAWRQTEQRRRAEDLERRVADRTTQLSSANAELTREMARRNHSEAELVALKDRLGIELAAMTRLHDLSTRLLASSELQPILDEVLSATITLQNADLGNVRLYNPQTRTLQLFAQRGFQPDFVTQFGEVDENSVTSSGRALRLRERVIIEDVQTDPLYEPYREVASRAGYRAQQSTPLFSRGGEVLGMITTHFHKSHRPSGYELQMTDLYALQAAEIIELKRAEDTVRRTREELVHVSRVTTMGELTASIAHEINQPLAAVVANAGACRRWLSMDNPHIEEACAALGRISRDANRASEVISGIRAFLKRGENARSIVAVEDVIHDVTQLVQGEARDKDVALIVSPAEDLPPVRVDRVQLQQVLLNLCINAIEAMGPIRERVRTLEVSSAADGLSEVRIAVCDCGPGLDPEHRDRIFDAFYTTKPGGMGMGLAISRSIINAHGGRLWATPNEGPGETFQFTLPVAGNPEHAMPVH